MRFPILWNYDPKQTIGSSDDKGNIELDTPLDLSSVRFDAIIQVTEYEVTNGEKQTKRAKIVALSLIPDDIGCEFVKPSDLKDFDKKELMRRRKGMQLNVDKELLAKEAEEKNKKEPPKK